MPGMNATYRNAIANHGGGLITHASIIDSLDAQIGDRQAVSFDTSTNGEIFISADLTFPVGAGVTVKGLRWHSALTAGTEYGGKDLATAETFSNAGDFKVLASGTKISHNASV